MKEYLSFLREHGRFLFFGALLAFLSLFGQTIFIGIYTLPVRETFDLSNTAFGSIYGTVTLCSAFCLFWIGRLLDRTHLRLYTLLVVAGMTIGCFGMALAPGLLAMIPFLFLVRFTGQGLMGHVSFTSMARYFETTRGRATSIAKLGFSLGEIVMPLIAVTLIAVIGWRESWLVYAFVLIFAIVPLIYWVLNDHDKRHEKWLARQIRPDMPESSEETNAVRSWSQKDVLKDWKFYIVLLNGVTYPMIATGIFFFLENISLYKGWEHDILAASFSVFAFSSALFSFLSGFLVDRFGAVRLLPVLTLPLSAGLATLALSGSPVAAPAFMFMAGISNGLLTAIAPAWAELYGTKHIGAIKSSVASVMIFSTSLAPPVMGILFDIEIPVATILLTLSSYALFTAGLQLVLPRRDTAKTQAPV